MGPPAASAARTGSVVSVRPMRSARRTRPGADEDRLEAAPRHEPTPPAAALVAQLQRSARKHAPSAMLQRPLQKGNEKATGKLVDKVQDLPPAAQLSLRNTHKGPVA